MNKDFMLAAIKEAEKNGKTNYVDGGPFGAVLVKDGEIIARRRNSVRLSKDPTAHAEINVIRTAAKKLKTNDLSNCVLYTSCEPCPMCLAAIIWANINEVYYANTRFDAGKIGFRDDKIYEYFKSNCKDKKIIYSQRVRNTNAIKSFDDYENFAANNKKIRY